jgi:hypothetical protein
MPRAINMEDQNSSQNNTEIFSVVPGRCATTSAPLCGSGPLWSAPGREPLSQAPNDLLSPDFPGDFDDECKLGELLVLSQKITE